MNIAAHNVEEDSGSVALNLISNLAFPLLLVGGLFLLSRRSQGGPVGRAADRRVAICALRR